MKTIVFAALAGAVGAAQASEITRYDFDANVVGGRNLSFSAAPNNSAGNGAWPSSIFDVWGVTDRTVNFDFADDSAGSFPADTFGILKTGKTDRVFGAEDLINPDNPSGAAQADWSFDISGYTDITVCIDFAAMGDFEASNDIFSIQASIDGGSFTNIFSFVVREDLDLYPYTLESGTVVNINDPMQVNGVVLDNNFVTLTSANLGSGSTLALRYSGNADGGSEVIIIDDIVIKGVPAPASAALIGLAGLVGLRRRR